MNTKDIAVTAEELNTLREKLKSLQTLKNFCSKITFPITVAGVLFFIIYNLDGHMVVTIMLVGMYEYLVIFDVLDMFKKEFKAMDDKESTTKESIKNSTQEQIGGKDE